MELEKNLVLRDKVGEWEIVYIIPDGCPLATVYQSAGNFLDKSIEWINSLAEQRKEASEVKEEVECKECSSDGEQV